jgi:peptidoglycan-associated lipoprotein
MWNKFVGLFAVLLLVAACETTPDESSDTSGGGSTTTGSTDGTMTAEVVESDTMTSEPAGPVPGTIDDFVVNVGDRVFFDLDKAALTASAQRTLERQAAWLSQYPSVTIMIEGHCDERGTREYNLALGDRRATSTKNYLVQLGVDPNRIETISFGKERPDAAGHNEAAWSQNRRGVTAVTSGGV